MPICYSRGALGHLSWDCPRSRPLAKKAAQTVKKEQRDQLQQAKQDKRVSQPVPGKEGKPATSHKGHETKKRARDTGSDGQTSEATAKRRKPSSRPISDIHKLLNPEKLPAPPRLGSDSKLDFGLDSWFDHELGYEMGDEVGSDAESISEGIHRAVNRPAQKCKPVSQSVAENSDDSASTPTRSQPRKTPKTIGTTATPAANTKATTAKARPQNIYPSASLTKPTILSAP